MLGFLWGGFLGPAFGWRVAFALASIPGVILATLLLMVVRETPRPASTHPTIRFKDGFTLLASHRTLRHMSLALILTMFSSHGAMNWMASYLIRHHHMPVKAVGLQLGLLFGAGAAVANFGTGFFVDRMGVRNIRWYLWVPALISLASIPFFCLTLLADTGPHALLWLILPGIFGVACGGPTLSILYLLTPARFRGTATALYTCLISLFGVGLGTWLIGIVSDLYASHVGEASIRYSLLTIVPAAALLAATQYIQAARALPADVARVGVGGAS
jgi:predicted MFS family arabinose efflux permease